MAVSVKIGFPKGKIDLSRISADQIKKVSVRAINKAIVSTRTAAIREVAKIYNIKNSVLQSQVEARKTNKAELTGRLMASAYTVPIKLFNPTFISGDGRVKTQWIGSKKTTANSTAVHILKRPRQQGIEVAIKKGEKNTIRSAFIAVSNNGGWGVRAYGEYGANFQFSDDPKHKTSRLMTVSPLKAIQGQEVSDRLTDRARELYEKEYTRLIVDITKGFNY